MGQLTFVRHAQASFFGPRYDQLSALGREQARILGEYWVASELPVATVYVGPLQRHRETCDIVAAAFRARGREWPEARLLPALDEHDGLKVAREALGRLATAPAALPADAPAAERERLQREYFRDYARLMRDWASGALTVAGAEPWAAFRARAEDALEQLTAGDADAGPGIVAFSSGGLVAAAVGALLGLDAERVIDLSLVLRNTALTEVSWSTRRRRLVSFNALPHLSDPGTVTSV